MPRRPEKKGFGCAAPPRLAVSSENALGWGAGIWVAPRTSRDRRVGEGRIRERFSRFGDFANMCPLERLPAIPNPMASLVRGRMSSAPSSRGACRHRLHRAGPGWARAGWLQADFELPGWRPARSGRAPVNCPLGRPTYSPAIHHIARPPDRPMYRPEPPRAQRSACLGR